ncbi:hypothetical protein [Actimicrobium antarcticum]|uniref:Uncharacterized protein n=1 Tax=Actimicrobium antarcticum TaxID=1051899 RepID=A0ABP7SXX7_9BURK
MAEFLHARSDFNELLAIVAEQRGIDPVLGEKDYWIMPKHEAVSLDD